jgi:hypothetical protein
LASPHGSQTTCSRISNLTICSTWDRSKLSKSDSVQKYCVGSMDIHGYVWLYYNIYIYSIEWYQSGKDQLIFR